MGYGKLALISLLVLVYVGKSVQYSCSESETCGCSQLPEDEYDIRCPKNSDAMFIIEVKSRELASVKCNLNPSWSDFTFQSTSPVEEIKMFIFTQCSLPNLTLHEITQKVGVQPINRIKFDSNKNLNSSLERRHFTGFPQVERLSLNSNGLRYLPADLLADLPELNTLELRENNVVLSAEFFEHLPKLQILELGNNRMGHIDPKLFRGLKQLNFLGLWGNELITVEDHTFDELTALSTLEISRNKLVTLPRDIFKSLANLSTLQMNMNKFSSLPENLLSQNLNLVKVSLSSNSGNWTGLPGRFLSNLPKLTEVQLIRNKLTVLPEDIFWGSTSLRNLTLRGNLLTTLPAKIFNDSYNLGTLDLSSNRISHLADGIFSALNKLERLELQNNNLTSISKELLLGLSGLKEINLEHNQITSVHPMICYPLTALEIMRLSYNQITIEDTQTAWQYDFGSTSPFSSCHKLRELHLAHNSVDMMYSDWTIQLINLRTLDLSYNKISSISTSDLQFISNDILVNLGHNNISRIDLTYAHLIATSQSNLSNTRNVRISIDDNPLICDCYVYNFLKYLNGEMHPNVQKLFHIMTGQLKCASPESMDRTLVSDLRSKNFQCQNSNCPDECECWFRPVDLAVVANCSYRNFSTAPGKMFNLKAEKLELDLTGNFLTEMPRVDSSVNRNVTKLLLSHNRISSISPNDVPPSLETLELDHNDLKRLNTTVLELLDKSTSLAKLTLHANPWECDCEARDFLNFLQTKYKKIPETSNVTCSSDGKSMSKISTSDLCSVATAMTVGISLGIAFLGLLVGTLAALYYRYQLEIKIWLFAHQLCLWFVTEEELDKDKLYDAFISFSQKDEDFVVNKLVSKLEEDPKPFKLCLHFRDWVPGEWIPTQIAKSVEDSRRTIVVLSPNFLESIWGRMEFKAAHKQALSEGRARVIVILFGDIGPTDKLDPELQAYLNMNTYVQWGDPWFWDKLKYALPHRLQINGDKNGLINLTGVPATPPAVTTPPADTLKTFTSDGSIDKGVLITDYSNNGMANFNSQDIRIVGTPNENEYDKNKINSQCTPV